MRTITARAPIRICDCGGWTDTWFARHGRVFNIAIHPCAEVSIGVFPAGPERPPVVLDVVDYGDRYAPALTPGRWDRHPLLEAAIASVGLPRGLCVDVRISSGVPAGAVPADLVPPAEVSGLQAEPGNRTVRLPRSPSRCWARSGD